MLAPPQLAATLNKRGGGPNSSSSSATLSSSSHHNRHQHTHHQHLSHLTQNHDAVHQHHYLQGVPPPQLHVHQHGPRVQLQHQSRSIEQQLYDLSINPDTGVTTNNLNNNNNNNNNYHHRHTYSLNNLNNSLNDLDTLINYNILSGIKRLKVDNPKETQSPQTGPTASGATSGSGGGNGSGGAAATAASTGTGNPAYQQSFYWLNKDPANRMLMDKAKQKREYHFKSFTILISQFLLSFLCTKQ